MAVLVDTQRPTGLIEPKKIGKILNGARKHNESDQDTRNGLSQIPPIALNNETVDNLPEKLEGDSQAVLALRNLIFDICNQNGGGHGGSAIGMAAIGVALYKYVMRYNPSDPSWFDRDRFVLSNGKKSSHGDQRHC